MSFARRMCIRAVPCSAVLRAVLCCAEFFIALMYVHYDRLMLCVATFLKVTM